MSRPTSSPSLSRRPAPTPPLEDALARLLINGFRACGLALARWPRTGGRLPPQGPSQGTQHPQPGQAVLTPGAAQPPADDPRTLILLIGRYAIPPARAGRWLQRGIPHLPLVFTDSGLRIGPLVGAEGDPCLFCLEAQRTQGQPEWPALASQLYDRRAPSEIPSVVLRGIAEVIDILARWQAADLSVHSEQRWVPFVPLPEDRVPAHSAARASGGSHTSRSVARNPECGCAQNELLFPASVPEAPPGRWGAAPPRGGGRPLENPGPRQHER